MDSWMERLEKAWNRGYCINKQIWSYIQLTISLQKTYVFYEVPKRWKNLSIYIKMYILGIELSGKVILDWRTFALNILKLLQNTRQVNN